MEKLENYLVVSKTDILKASKTHKSLKVSRKKATIVYTIGSVITTVVVMVKGIILIPFYVEHLGSELYGYWLATGGFMAWIGMVDIGGASINRIRCGNAYGNKDLETVSNYFWAGLVVCTTVIFVFLSLFAIAFPFIPKIVNISAQYVNEIQTALLVTVLSTALNFYAVYFKDFLSAILKNGCASVGAVLGQVSSLLYIFYGLGVAKQGIMTLAISSVISVLTPLIVNVVSSFFFVLSHKLRIHISIMALKDYFKTSPTVFGAKLTGTFVVNLPSILISRFMGPHVLVSYTTSIRAIEVLNHFINQPLSGLFASMSNYLGDKNITDAAKLVTYRKISMLFLCSTIFAFGGFVLLNSNFVELLLERKFFVSQKFTFLFGVSYYLTLRNSIFQQFIGAGGIISKSALLVIYENILIAVLQYASVRYLGLIGFPFAIIVGKLAFTRPLNNLMKSVDFILQSSMKIVNSFWIVICLYFACLSVISKTIPNTTFIHFFTTAFVYSLISISIIIFMYKFILKTRLET